MCGEIRNEVAKNSRLVGRGEDHNIYVRCSLLKQVVVVNHSADFTECFTCKFEEKMCQKLKQNIICRFANAICILPLPRTSNWDDPFILHALR